MTCLRPICLPSKTPRWVVSILFVLALDCGIFGPSLATEDNDGIFAVVNSEVISATDFESFFARFQRKNLYHGGSAQQISALRPRAIDALIDERLLAQEADRLAIAGDPSYVESQVATLEERYGQSDEWAAMKPRLPELRSILLRQSKLPRLEDMIREVSDPDDQELLDFYNSNNALFTMPAAAELQVLLLVVHPGAPSEEWQAARQESEGHREELLKGANFGELARAHSDHESASQGGHLGFVHRGELAKNVERAVDALDPGEVSPPLRVLEGYALFKLLQRRTEHLRAYEDVRERAKALFVREQADRQWSALLERLRQTAEVRLFDEQGGRQFGVD